MSTRAKDSHSGDARKPLVLVVDDLPLIRRLVRRELSQFFDVVEAENVSGALNAFDSHADIRVVVSDCHMGLGPTGLHLLKEVSEKFPDVIRVLASGTVSQRTVDALPANLVHGFIGKPWNPGAVRRMVCALSAAKRDGE